MFRQIEKDVYFLLVLILLQNWTCGDDYSRSPTDTSRINKLYFQAQQFAGNYQFDSSAVYYQKASEIEFDHGNWDDYASCINNLIVQQKQGDDLESALESAQNLLDFCLIHLNEQHQETINCYDNLAIIFEDKLDYKEALRYFNKALKT